jgi:hypothetical protein
MSYLNATQLANMRTAADLALPDSGTPSRATLVSDSMGGYSETWANSTAAACRLDPPGNARLDQWQEKIMNRAVFILSTAYDTDIQTGDRWTISGSVYEVLGLLDASWEIMSRAVVVKL